MTSSNQNPGSNGACDPLYSCAEYRQGRICQGCEVANQQVQGANRLVQHRDFAGGAMRKETTLVCGTCCGEKQSTTCPVCNGKGTVSDPEDALGLLPGEVSISDECCLHESMREHCPQHGDGIGALRNKLSGSSHSHQAEPENRAVRRPKEVFEASHDIFEIITERCSTSIPNSARSSIENRIDDAIEEALRREPARPYGKETSAIQAANALIDELRAENERLRSGTALHSPTVEACVQALLRMRARIYPSAHSFRESAIERLKGLKTGSEGT